MSRPSPDGCPTPTGRGWDTARRLGSVVVRAGLVCSVGILLAIGFGPRSGRYRVVTVLTGSMRPTADPGSLVIDTPERLSALRLGDVITYSTPIGDHPVISHRIVAIKGAGTAHPIVRTKGDANPAADPWEARLEGTTVWRVRYSFRHVGAAIRLLRAPQTRRFATFGAPLLLAAIWLREIWSPARGDEAEAEVPGDLDGSPAS
ncbi:MAG: signal peptidase [Acidimicrobiales bacterium]|nr:signal peptidase [Acidimicrobiales bacterium]